MAGKWGRSRRARGGVSGVRVMSALGRCSRDATHVQACKESRASAGDGGVPSSPEGFARGSTVWFRSGRGSTPKSAPMGSFQPLATRSPARVCSRTWRRWAMRRGRQSFHAPPRPLRTSDPPRAAPQAHCPANSLKISPCARGPGTLAKNFSGRREVFRGTPTII